MSSLNASKTSVVAMWPPNEKASLHLIMSEAFNRSIARLPPSMIGHLLVTGGSIFLAENSQLPSIF